MNRMHGIWRTCCAWGFCRRARFTHVTNAPCAICCAVESPSYARACVCCNRCNRHGHGTPGSACLPTGFVSSTMRPWRGLSLTPAWAYQYKARSISGATLKSRFGRWKNGSWHIARDARSWPRCDPPYRIEVTPIGGIRRDRINRQKPLRHRIIIPLLHVAMRLLTRAAKW